MPLSEKASWLTVFLTPWGKYRFLRAPFGFVSAGDSFCCRTDAAFNGLDLATVVYDSACAFYSFKGLVTKFCEVLERCCKHLITLNPKKKLLYSGR